MAKGERCSRTEEAAPDLDQYAKDALDQLFNKEEQSYEEFLQGFTFLKKGDVTGFKAHSSNSGSQNGTTCQEKKKDDVVVKQQLSPESHHLVENDSIPEEVLGPGSTVGSILMRTAESSSGSVLKVDNFLVCEDEASDDDDIEEDTVLDPLLEDEFLSSSYSPSAPTTPSTSKSKEIKDNSSQDTKFKVDLDEAKEICYLSAVASNLPGEVDGQELTDQGVPFSVCVVDCTTNGFWIDDQIGLSKGNALGV